MMFNSNELGKWLKKFFGLAFIFSAVVVDAFHELISMCPHDNGLYFLTIYLHNYIENHYQSPPSIWAKIPSLSPRFKIILHREKNFIFFLLVYSML